MKRLLSRQTVLTGVGIVLMPFDLGVVLPGSSRAQEGRQEEVAQERRVLDKTVHVRAFPRWRRNRRRKRQEAEADAPRLPARQQRQRVPWRVPNVGAVVESRAEGSPKAS